VAQGDTLAKIARSLRADSGAATPANIDQTMMAVYRANPDAFGGNINILRRGSVLRLPGADQIAALNQSEAISEVHRQMDAWRGASGGTTHGHLRLVTPGTGGGATGGGDATAANAEAQALKDRVKDLEGQLAASHRLIDIRNSELSALQRKLGVAPTAPTPAPIPEPKAPPVQTTPAPPVTAAQPPAAAPRAPRRLRPCPRPHRP
jgi:pilus assembly protein FimV